MKKQLSLVLITLILASPAFASSKKKSTAKTAAPTTQVATPAAEPAHMSSGPSDWKLSASAGLGEIGSSFVFGVLGKAETHVTVQGTHLKVGGETGLLFSPSPSAAIIPLLGIATYEFPNNGGLNAYVGMGLGLAISTSGSGVHFAGLLTPGVKLSDKYYAEIPFGTLGGSFAIFPSVGMHF